MCRPDLPSLDQSLALASRLAGPRGRLLRRVQIGRRSRVLEAGCGHGVVTAELERRCPGRIIALDRDVGAASAHRASNAALLAADAEALPFPPGTFDVVFFQNTLLWVRRADVALREAARVLEPGGCLVAIEPDYGGMLEHPAEIALKEVWIRALTATGADPFIGRRLPSLCEASGLDPWFELQAVPQPADAADLDLLATLPLSSEERTRLAHARARIATRRGRWAVLVHLPYVLVAARKQGRLLLDLHSQWLGAAPL